MNQKDMYDKNGFVSIDEIIGSNGKSRTDDNLESKIADVNSTENMQTDLLEEILTDKVKFFKQILGEIDSQVKDREQLKTIIIKKLDERMCMLTTKTYEVDSWGMGNNKDMDSRRTKLESEIETLAKQKTEEEQQSWKDIALLKQEHRQFSQQYRNALRRVKIILPDFKE